MLCLEIEWLLGVCFAARSPADPSPDWPPQPDRVFSALVASWAARGGRPEERAALEWLEALAPPRLAAAPFEERAAGTAYVPTNDASATDIRVLPDRRNRQRRRFPAATLAWADGRPHLRMTWSEPAPPEHIGTLQALAHDTSYVGHSASLVRCFFHVTQPESAGLQPATTEAAPYAGRFRELEALHERHVAAADAQARPARAWLTQPVRPPAAGTPRSVFGRHWTVLEFAGGDRPEITAAAVIGRAMRDALMSKWPDPIPEWLSGHAPDSSPSRSPHLAVVPLGNVGFTRSTGLWHGLALVLPAAIDAEWTTAATPQAFAGRQALETAFSALAAEADDPGAPIALRLGRNGKVLVRRIAHIDAQSLKPSRYGAVARVWSTATPVALDRHLKGDEWRAEAAGIVTASCTRIGLPPPVAVHVHKHAAILGAPSAWPAGGAPRWTGWARPGALSSRSLVHATIRFEPAVAGPLILGAGRFFGLGLCLPVLSDAAR